jgi:uncharacterized protein with PIN domain
VTLWISRTFQDAAAIVAILTGEPEADALPT